MRRLGRLTAHVSALSWQFLSWTVVLAAQTIPASTSYDTKAEHLLNQLNSMLFTRVAPDGTVYGSGELDILYWQGTEHLLTEPLHSAAVRLLDRFIEAKVDQRIHDPLKRALLQRDLWQLFDWAAAPGQTTYLAQRAALEDRLAIIVRGLALSDAEIAGLPASDARMTPYPDLLRGLFDPNGDWVTARSADSAIGPLALRHTEAFNGHSVFLVMVRLPNGRQQTVDYLNSLRDFEGPLVYARQRQLAVNPDVPQFPVGTEWALVRRLCVIDVQGHIRVTPLIESVQLRRYDSIEELRVDLDDSGTASARPAQQMFEFEMDKLRAGALKAIAPNDVDFQFVHFSSQGGDPFEMPTGNEDATPNPTAARFATLATCHQCHGSAGIQSVASFFFGQTVQRLQATAYLPAQIEKLYTPPSNPEQEIEATILWKYRQFDWGLLQGLWRSPPRVRPRVTP